MIRVSKQFLESQKVLFETPELVSRLLRTLFGTWGWKGPGDSLNSLGARGLKCKGRVGLQRKLNFLGPNIRDRPNTVSESTVSNTELSDFFPLRALGGELSEFLSA